MISPIRDFPLDFDPHLFRVSDVAKIYLVLFFFTVMLKMLRKGKTRRSERAIVSHSGRLWKITNTIRY